VHGVGDASGNFALLIISTRLGILFDQALQDLSSPQYEALDWMTNKDSTDLQFTLSEDELVERFVVLVFYFATGGESWSDQAGFRIPLTETCSWNSGELGVVCNNEGSVVEFVLRKFPHSSTCWSMNCANKLILTLLSNMNVAFNGISGTLPTEVGLLSSLKVLALDNNNLIGLIPHELGQLSTLQFLNLLTNAMTGTTPTELGTLSSLKGLGLGSNNLIGSIPSELGQISTLQEMLLFDNAITGTMPTELGTMSSLVTLSLALNNLRGSIPSELGQILTLEFLSLRDNAVTFTLPSELGFVTNVFL
jgi:hypothetical protein